MLRKISEVFHVDIRYFTENIPLKVAMQSVLDTADEILVIGDRIKTLRIEKGWSQKELAIQSGVAASNLSKMERGLLPISEKAAKMLCNALEVGVDYLLLGDEDRKNYPVNEEMIQWLWQHPQERAEIWKMMKKRYCLDAISLW